MPITLITGTPGAGKTLFAVKLLAEKLVPTGRTIYTNIAGLREFAPNVKAVPDDAAYNWRDYDDGCIFIFDEIQRQYPVKNSMTKNPEYISGYETHRHRGMDFYFITQGPYLIDRHLHPLIDRHYHIYRPFGLKRSTVMDWNGINPNPAPKQSRSNASVKNFRFPKKYFDLYQSATVHTVKARVPWKLVLTLGGMVAAFALGGTYLYSRLASSSLFGDTPTASIDADPSNSLAGGQLDPQLGYPPSGTLDAPCAALVATGSRAALVRFGVALASLPLKNVSGQFVTVQNITGEPVTVARCRPSGAQQRPTP